MIAFLRPMLSLREMIRVDFDVESMSAQLSRHGKSAKTAVEKEYFVFKRRF